MKVSVLGACGRIGLPLTWLIAKAGHKTTGIDPNFQMAVNAQQGANEFPYVEDGFETSNQINWKPVLRSIDFTSLHIPLDEADVIVVVIGTPVDGENNPRIENIVALFKEVIIPRMKEGVLLILRSTVSPGVTELIHKMIDERRPGLFEGSDYFLAFAPERVSQGHSVKETGEFPQLIGAFSDKSYKAAKNFFTSIGISKCVKMTPREAEYGKLITNMYRYVNIALANEFYMIAANQGVNAHRVIELANLKYPRMSMPLPGPNAAGPCLFKDGKLLVQDVPYGDLINVAFHINEGMPAFMFKQLIQKAKETNIVITKVGILGMAFKPGNDDIRFSASYKLKKILLKNGIEVMEMDQYKKPNTWPSFNSNMLPKQDAFIVMTPHPEMMMDFAQNLQMLMFDDEVIIVDGWNVLAPNFNNGIYTVGEYKTWLKSS
jgi:UDP-N-acetyl-D-mannosaminuronic acid dehydrogenase